MWHPGSKSVFHGNHSIQRTEWTLAGIESVNVTYVNLQLFTRIEAIFGNRSSSRMITNVCGCRFIFAPIKVACQNRKSRPL